MIRKVLRDFAANIHKIPKKTIYIILVAAPIVVIAGYVVWSAVPKQVEFSYGGTTCAPGFLFLPGLQKSDTSSGYSISYKTTLGGIAASETCFAPVSAPKEGSIDIKSTLLGFLRTNYTMHVGTAPKVVGSVTSAPVALTKPVVFTFDKTDKVYSYALVSEGKTQPCAAATGQLSCRIDQLGLQQGSDHTVSLTRSFKGGSAVKVTDKTISILPAVAVKDSSVKPDQTVYDKPKTFTVATDKPLKSATAVLELVDGDRVTAVETAVTTKDATITATTPADLAREKQYQLTVRSADATDDSTLNQPYVITFKTSGGPKVTGVNIGTSGVDPAARVVVTFDQPLADTADIAKFASIAGVPASVTKQGAQVIFSLQNAGRCSAFSLKITKGIPSATNGLASATDWSYASRVVCRATSVIGYSVKGRPITAYYYGSGATTIMFTGGMHGSEASGMQTMQAWTNYLDTHAPEIPAGKQVVIVPNTNPDGIASNNRYNANGVNIDRNFPTANWSKDIQTTSGIKAGGGGSAPLSEPETKALYNLTSSLRPRAQLSFHAQGRLVGANDYADSRAIGNVYASTVGYATMFDNAEDVMGYTFTGEYDTWVGEKLGRPSLVIELPSASGNYLSSQLSALWKMVNL